uniref:Alkane hydroxylase MAH1 n=1 Tax=Cicer arietinum TaxID=3827 RepID=A0A1S2Y1X8_CICAR|nr:alkane hydroxylase MAH1 [Cicer arietinum]
MLPAVLHNQSNIPDFATSIMKHHGGTFHFKRPWFTNTNFILTSDAMNVHQFTSKNFINYGKESDFHEIFEWILNSGPYGVTMKVFNFIKHISTPRLMFALSSRAKVYT